MDIGQAVIEALESLSANKLRSGLTILGIVIGVGAVIAMLAVGQGAQNSITSTINGIGVNLLFVTPGNRQVRLRNVQPLTLADANAIGDPLNAPDVAAVAPVVNVEGTATFGGNTDSPNISGVTANYQTVRNVSLLYGSWISDQEVLQLAPVAVIGSQTAETLFGTTDNLIGQEIRINNQPFRIIGIKTPQGGNSFGSADDVIFVPITTAQVRLSNRGRQNVSMIFVSATSQNTINQAVDEVSQILRTRHRTALGADDFTVTSQQDILSTAQSVTGTLTIFLGGVAGISLLVGGIGIMNIMLVSVTERTREIGLRKALGARKRDILVQFLTESALLSLMGGIIGIGLGWLISTIVGRVASSGGNELVPVIGLNGILLATLFSTAVGLFFGLYPANRAASLVPVEALRYE
jgi:putative ABC transport system permease protein